MSSALAKLERARADLAESRTLGEVKQIRDLAEAARNGTSRKLAPGEKFTAQVRSTIYTKNESREQALRRVQSA